MKGLTAIPTNDNEKISNLLICLTHIKCVSRIPFGCLLILWMLSLRYVPTPTLPWTAYSPHRPRCAHDCLSDHTLQLQNMKEMHTVQLTVHNLQHVHRIRRYTSEDLIVAFSLNCISVVIVLVYHTFINSNYFLR